MARTNQQIRFCRSSDGVRLAYAVTGSGMPLLRAPHWITHLEHDDLFWGHLYDGLGERFSLYRFDQRGCGLSDRSPATISFDAWVRDMEAVADAARLERFAIFGVSQGAAAAVAYAARHPERVSHLILMGGFLRGVGLSRLSPVQREELDTFKRMVRVGWDGGNPFMRHAFTKLLIPDADPAAAEGFNMLMKESASSETASRIIEIATSLDVSAEVGKVACPTLVLHSRHELSVSFERGRKLASAIPGARFVSLDSPNHLLLRGEPALRNFFEAVDGFIPRSPAVSLLGHLTPRENDVLEHVAQGLDNAQIAARLGLSEKTVRNYIVAILDKLQAETRAQAIVRARELGFGRQGR